MGASDERQTTQDLPRERNVTGGTEHTPDGAEFSGKRVLVTGGTKGAGNAMPGASSGRLGRLGEAR